MIHLLIHLLSKSIFQLDGSGTEMLRDIDIFSSYLKNIHDGIIIPGHEDIDGVAARGLVNGRDPPAAGGIYRQYPHVPEIINIYSAGNMHRGRWI